MRNLTLWSDYDETLGDSPSGALDLIIRRLLAPIGDLTIGEIDRIADRAVKAGMRAIVDTIEVERNRPPSALTGDEPRFA